MLFYTLVIHWSHKIRQQFGSEPREREREREREVKTVPRFKTCTWRDYFADCYKVSYKVSLTPEAVASP